MPNPDKIKKQYNEATSKIADIITEFEKNSDGVKVGKDIHVYREKDVISKTGFALEWPPPPSVQ